MPKTATTETKTDWLGDTVNDAAGNPVKVTTVVDTESEENTTLETKTKTDWLGDPVLDGAGNPILETEEQ